MLSLLIIWNFAWSQPLSLKESLALVATQSPEVHIARLQADQVNLERIKILSNVLRVQASGSWLDFGEPLESYIIGDGSTEVDCTSFESFGFGDLCDSFSEPLLVREERIFDGSLQVAIPITALYSIIQGYAANEHVHTIKSLEIEQTKQRIELSAIEIYVQTLDIQAQRRILEDTITRLKSHQRSAQAFVEQGLAHSVQAKELAYAIVQAEMGMRQLEQGYLLLCQQMSLLLGLDTPFSPIPLEDNIIEPKKTEIHTNLNHQIAYQQHQAAKAGFNAAMGDLFPSVAVVAATTATQGQGPFTPTSQTYIGLSVQGEFAWGSKWMTLKQRKMDVLMAEKGLVLQQQSLPLQQEQRRQSWQNTIEMISLAQSKLEIETIKRDQSQAQYEGHQITMGDLLDAESRYADAQIELSRATHQKIIAQAKYQQSLNSDTLYFKP